MNNYVFITHLAPKWIQSFASHPFLHPLNLSTFHLMFEHRCRQIIQELKLEDLNDSYLVFDLGTGAFQQRQARDKGERFKHMTLESFDVGDTFSMEANGNILEEGTGGEMVRVI